MPPHSWTRRIQSHLFLLTLALTAVAEGEFDFFKVDSDLSSVYVIRITDANVATDILLPNVTRTLTVGAAIVDLNGNALTSSAITF